jgi:four helix bundle protein
MSRVATQRRSCLQHPKQFMKSSYRELLAWQKAMDLVDEVYRLTGTFPKSEVYLLSVQMRRAATSIPSNIAEGQGRYSLKDFRHFLRDARGSALELETQCLIAQRQEYITARDIEDLELHIGEVVRLINGLIKYIDRALRLRTANRELRTRHE